MKKVLAVLFVACFLMVAAGVASADSDDAKWVAKCIKDNSDAKVPIEVITKYCTCMNNKMSSDETRTITEWEKSHPDERKACEREAGWN